MANGYDKISRLKSMLKVKMTVDEIAGFMGCGPRTVFRHLDAISKQNCGLRKFKENKETYYIIQTDKNFSFNQDIAKQLEKVKDSISENPVQDAKTVSLIDKVMKALQTKDPEELKPEAIAIDPNYILDYGPFSDNVLQATNVNNVLKAIRDGFSVRISYTHAAISDEKVTKEIYPVKVIMRMDTLYLVAGEIDENGNESFRNYLFQNISKVIETKRPAPALKFDPEVHYMYTFGKYTNDDKVENISLKIKAEANWLKSQFERSHFNPPAVIHNEKGEMIVDLKLRITPDFKTWLLGVAPEIKILKPASLKEEIKKMMQQALTEMD